MIMSLHPNPTSMMLLASSLKFILFHFFKEKKIFLFFNCHFLSIWIKMGFIEFSQNKKITSFFRHMHASQTKLEEETSTPIEGTATARNATRSQTLMAWRNRMVITIEEERSQRGSCRPWRKSRTDSKRNVEWLRIVYEPMHLSKEIFLSLIPPTTCHSQNIHTTEIG